MITFVLGLMTVVVPVLVIPGCKATAPPNFRPMPSLVRCTKAHPGPHMRRERSCATACCKPEVGPAAYLGAPVLVNPSCNAMPPPEPLHSQNFAGWQFK